MRDSIGDLQRVQHILDAILEIESYVQQLDYESFEASTLVRSAVERQLTIIGEACNSITEESKLKSPEINWRGIRGFRNVIIHEYFGTSIKMIWAVVINELPNLKVFAINFISSKSTN